ncbi:magnesium transporter CorA family protein [Vagococcus zengguangii]|uniref:Uncharacterized protein n=1 Tax=Vagococcus zengguangii TaxID=2571750 RepID=A0A4D7CVJ4_9ENTE|nr:CorA family divalent cation transporter [Vagococcus zengguangii]QCI86260.1 hypothetical protein FA707_04460 [Vagococcus zengguangii]TLG79633.1 hypothetical protein FE258_07995 [Vagococcus zengguangii]
MEILNFVSDPNLLGSWHYQREKASILIVTNQQLVEVMDKVGFDLMPKHYHKHTELPIRFEALSQYDYFSYLFFERTPKSNMFEFERFCLHLNQELLILEVQNGGRLHQDFLADIIGIIENKTLNQAYLEVIDWSLSRMFESLFEFEEALTKIENNIIEMEMDFKIEEIIMMKNQCFKAKKYMRMFQYVSDDLLLNKNGFIKTEEASFVQNIDSRINRVYEYSLSLYEMAVHLLEIYDSTVNTVTNATINKLTVFTVFVTPITVLTGIYGMNFINMPELRNPNGYYILLGVMVLIMLIIYYVLKKIKLL